MGLWHKTKKCKQCGKLYRVGYNGISGGLCDECAGVQRDANEYAWYGWEQSQTYRQVDTGEIRTVTRDEAFGKKK